MTKSDKHAIYPSWAIRDNQLRLLDNFYPPTGPVNKATFISNMFNSVIDGNVVNFSESHALFQARASKVSFFNNRSKDGSLVQGWNATASAPVLDVTDQIEDLLTLCSS